MRRHHFHSMWPVCLICAFFFPQPQPGDVEDIKRAVESYYAEPRGPWSEAIGPFVQIELHLFTPDWGVADVTLTWISVFGLRPERRRVAIAKNTGEWRVVPIGP